MKVLKQLKGAIVGKGRDADLERRVRLTWLFCLVLLSMGIFGFVLFKTIIKVPLISNAAGLALVLGALTMLLLFKKKVNLTINGLLLIVSSTTCFCIYFMRGLYSAAMFILVMIPLLAAFVIGMRWSVLWFCLISLSVTTFYIMEIKGYQFPNILAAEQLPHSFAVAILMVLIACAFFSFQYEKARLRAKEAAEEARESLEQRVKERTAELEETTKELIEKAEELWQTQAQLIQSAKMAAVGQLGAGVAHELNNPLGGILGYSQFILSKLKRPDFGPEDLKACQGHLESIERESTRCKAIVGNLLRFSRKPLYIRPLPLETEKLIQDSLSIVGHQLKLGNIELVTEFDPHLARVEGVANQLQQVFINLILNAQQAMPEGGQLKIKAHSLIDKETNAPTQVRIEFIDTGYGISEENLDRIFEPFFTTRQDIKATGLGLAVSHGIIEDHKGRIEVTSQVGKGTTFTVTLPVTGKG